MNHVVVPGVSAIDGIDFAVEVKVSRVAFGHGIRPAANPTLATEEPSTQDLACHRRAACSDARTFSYENKPSREES